MNIMYFTIASVILLVISFVFFAAVHIKDYKGGKETPRNQLLVNEDTSSEEDAFDYEVSPEDMMLCNQVIPDVGPELGSAYDEKLEFPKTRLKFGKSLGSGEFGRVVKAEAIGIHDFEPSTEVAVKMAKERGNPVHEAALMKELKILMILGYHLNILNLLGAVTRSPKGIMVILEYCRHGSLWRFLRKHRNRFLLQETEIPENPEDEKQLQVLSEPTGFEDNEQASIHFQNSPCEGAEFHNENGSEWLNSEEANSSPSGIIPSEKCSRRSRKRKHYLHLSDLMSYAFQCARGMCYLASKKLIHRDLAARNILLAEGNVIKISDFGLTKDLYNYPNYMPNKDVPLPFKWMAIESLADGVFTTKSDVWSFGVVLWELFTLGVNPYPGIPVDENFYYRLKEGHRMEKPQFATDDIYQIMRRCWREKPGERPNFWTLEETLGDLLDDVVRQHYVKLNESYARRNEQASFENQEGTSKKASFQNSSSFRLKSIAEDRRSNCRTSIKEEAL